MLAPATRSDRGPRQLDLRTAARPRRNPGPGSVARELPSQGVVGEQRQEDLLESGLLFWIIHQH